jgi:hypothetical protein
VVVFPAKVGGVSLFKNVQTNSWTQKVPGTLSLGTKWPAPPRTQLKKEWNYNRRPPF